MRRIRIRGKEGERGVALVEMAIVAPLLGLLMAGIFEFGMAWRNELSVSAATRSSARVASNLGTSISADKEAVYSLQAGVESINNAELVAVMIFPATSTGGVPANCFNFSGDPVGTGSCNYYSKQDLDDLASNPSYYEPVLFGSSGNSCTVGTRHARFCPSSRVDRQGSGLTAVGVWVQVQQGWQTGIFPGDGLTIVDKTIMRIEPRG